MATYSVGSFYIVVPVGMFVVGFLSCVTKCTADSSWFVKKAAADLISNILSSTKSNTSSSATYSGILFEEEEKMIATVFAPMMSDEVYDFSQLSVCLEILDSRDSLISTFSILHLDKQQIVERIYILLNCLPASLSCKSERRLLEILASVCEAYDCLVEANQKLVELVTTLVNNGKILLAVVVGVWILARFITTLD